MKKRVITLLITVIAVLSVGMTVLGGSIGIDGPQLAPNTAPIEVCLK